MPWNPAENKMDFWSEAREYLTLVFNELDYRLCQQKQALLRLVTIKGVQRCDAVVKDCHRNCPAHES